MTSFAIIAGGGDFPDLVADAIRARGDDVFAVRLEGAASAQTLKDYDGIWITPARMGPAFKACRARGITRMILIGRMKRPAIWSLRPDFTTLRLLPKILPALCCGGDDALLRSVRRALEGAGFALHPAQEFIAEATAAKGAMGRHRPTIAMESDIELGRRAAYDLGLRDKGQAVVVHDGRLAGQEGVDGTDALIARAARPGAILVKTAKPGQDRALDLPSIGMETVRRCAQGGYAGLAVEAGGTLIAHKKQVIDFADAHGLFLVGI